ncbi:MAG: IclR family transcriptional regulator [Solirubrobacteraceae bacterium]
MQNTQPTYPISSVDNALRLLLMFRNQPLIRVTDAGDALGVGRSTAHRLLATLQHHGFVDQDPDTRAYRAGPALAEIGLAIVRADGLREHMRPYMERLRDELNETIQLVVLQSAQCLFIETVESHRPLRTASRVGITVPAHCLSGGKALLAELSLGRLHELYPAPELPAATEFSIKTRDALEADLEEVRRRGYATNFGESEEEIGSIGVAVHDAEGRPRAGIAVSGPLSRVNESRREQVEAIASAARRMAKEASTGLV